MRAQTPGATASATGIQQSAPAAAVRAPPAPVAAAPLDGGGGGGSGGSTEQELTGVVAQKRPGASFGFINVPGRARDVFFHVSELVTDDSHAAALCTGAAVTFVLRKDPASGRELAARLRLAPPCTHVALERVEPGAPLLGMVVRPATGPRGAGGADAGSGSASSSGKGVVRFVEAAAAGAAGADAVRHLLYDEPHELTPGQLVLFRRCTDLQAEAAAKAAAAARGAAAQQPSGTGAGGTAGTAAGSAAGRVLLSYQRAVEVRPAEEAQVAASPYLRQQATLLGILQAAVQAKQEQQQGEGADGPARAASSARPS